MDLCDSLSLEAASRALITTEHEHNRENPILKGIVFNIKFILTYQLCLLALVAILTAVHWTTKKRQTIRRSCIDDESISSIASSETIVITEVVKHDRLSETSALLQHTRSKKTTSLRRSTRWVRSLLMMHPTFKVDLAGNDVSAFIILILGLNIFYALYRAPLERPLILIFADRVGLLFVANLPWLYLLGAKNQPFRLLTGASYEGLNVLHRELGKWLAVLALLHAVGMIVVWYDFLLPRGLDFWTYLSRRVIWTGFCALACYEVLTLTSLKNFRDWWYEVFLGCHIFLQSAALGFLYFHYDRAKLYVGIALAIFLTDRLVYRLTMKTRPFVADITVMEDGQTVMLSADWALARRARLPPWLKLADLNHGWSTTDHVFLTVPAMARKHKIQAHPFTIASAAPAQGDSHAWLNLIIRVRDGFTRDLLEHAKLNPTVMIRLDGPYGSDHAVNMLLDSSAAIILAGGSGIAVAFPLVWHLLRVKHRCVCLIWIVNDSRHIEWIGRERLNELCDLGLTLVVPPATSTAGRPDVAQLLQDNVRELTNDDPNCKTALVVSGPDAMNRTARNTAARMARQGLDIRVAVEVFDW